MATFWERAAHSVYRMFFLYFDCNLSYFSLSHPVNFQIDLVNVKKIEILPVVNLNISCH